MGRMRFALLIMLGLAGCTDGTAPPNLVDEGVPDEAVEDLSSPDLGPDLLNGDALFGSLQLPPSKPTIDYGLSSWAHVYLHDRKMMKRTS